MIEPMTIDDLVAIAEEIASDNLLDYIVTDTQGREINSVYVDHAKRAIIIGRIDDELLLE